MIIGIVCDNERVEKDFADSLHENLAGFNFENKGNFDIVDVSLVELDENLQYRNYILTGVSNSYHSNKIKQLGGITIELEQRANPDLIITSNFDKDSLNEVAGKIHDYLDKIKK